jgi:hypothetical protein
MFIHMAFLDKDVRVNNLEDPRVAYSWTCGDDNHEHTIDCLWVWHNCDGSLLDPEAGKDYRGWMPSGVGLHTLISIEPLHIEASVYWPACCGLHGFIRNGRWESV